MNQKALHVLEYDKIIERLTEHATSEPGKKLCRELVPSSDIKEIRKNQEKTKDAISRIFKKGSTNFGDNKDFQGILKALKIGSALDMAALLKLAAFLDNVNRVKTYGRPQRDDEERDSLSESFEMLEPLTFVSAEIRRCIISEDEMSSDASPALKHIRRGMMLTNDRIHEQLGKIINGSMRTYLQDTVVTMRGDRYCIPVRAEYKSQINGIVHDQSSSGSTLFIEPQAIVELNNKLREMILQETAEIEKILAELSLKVAEHVDSIKYNADIMTDLDFVFAKASYALEINAITPVFNEQHAFDIKKGRHPLIDKDKVVPIDVYAGRDFDMLIITGPNTGGKTVTLKTVGLLTLMGQAGLAIPAGDRSELSVFTEVYADIGDEQSIEQSLSTFSSHMTNCVSILEKADENSLCLFDELGAGTDPTEGAALAISILNDLHERKIRTMATTHYSELKVYALNTPGIKNASCEFDVESLKPTYKLLIGIPGKSNAFAISSKLGLPDRIIEAAKEQIGTEDKKFEDLLADLEKSRKTIESESLEIAQYKKEVEELKTQLEEKTYKLDKQRDEIIRKANEEARDILQEAKDVADETIRTFRKAGPDATMQDLERARTSVGQKISDKNKSISKKVEKPKETHPILKESQLKLGETVKIVSMGLKGTISSKPDKDGYLFVQCGIMRTKANIRDLVLVQDEDGKAAMKKFYGRNTSSSGGKMDLSRSANIRTEINLIGKNSDDALAALDKYLDDAYMSHLNNVRVVHGKGAGILRQAVHQYLKGVPYVKSFKLGEFGEGDAGVTIVTFIK
ncbi:MAG: endonuclease MutS2 [Butyrivibrio sp.]|jgi:DNA mismatch repair protein MutS2|uniref:endonuclease MutS2 n=1 Tax=Butyrivibrio sp. TaxID=28121 RepID=UPI001EB60060|nr:endonuclease MutS2 [Butyrivibrio sp.]MBE5842470.1 endonuclease MutS2 [Butyrivibrio sp.]MCR4757044.1 endonuclease MutS2 [Butyrivibrio sp.]